MSEVKFSEDHEWVRLEEGGSAVVGITDYAQDQLGELVFVELPEVGTALDQGADACVIESVKAAGEVKSPVTGVVTAVNDSLADEPGKVNEDPLGEGWILRMDISDPAELDALMDKAAYDGYVESL